MTRNVVSYVEGRLEPARAQALEAHLLVCDRCFAACIARVLLRA